MKLKISILNNISPKGVNRCIAEGFEVINELRNPDAILCRSAKILPEDLNVSVKAIARAGAGTDKICVDECTKKGIPVFNTPGANANSVKELVNLSLLLASRNVIKGIDFVKNRCESTTDSTVLTEAIEKGKKQFVGREIKGKTLGVIGLGAIGSIVAKMALDLGMEVIGYDPTLSVDSAWNLSSKIKKMQNLSMLLRKSDFITLHLPMLKSTRHIINDKSLSYVKDNACLLNFSREEIIDPLAVEKSLDSGKLSYLIADFPYKNLGCRDDTILMPHIGASTVEAEDNCAIVATKQLCEYLKKGNITNSVNFPSVSLDYVTGNRMTYVSQKSSNLLNQVMALLTENKISVVNMINKTRNSITYNIIDTEQPLPNKALQHCKNMDGIYSVRTLTMANYQPVRADFNIDHMYFNPS